MSNSQFALLYLVYQGCESQTIGFCASKSLQVHAHDSEAHLDGLMALYGYALTESSRGCLLSSHSRGLILWNTCHLALSTSAQYSGGSLVHHFGMMGRQANSHVFSPHLRSLATWIMRARVVLGAQRLLHDLSSQRQ